MATSKEMKLNGEKSNLVLGTKDKAEYLKERNIGVVTSENTKEEVANVDARNEAKKEEKRANSKKKVIDMRKRGKMKKMYSRHMNEMIANGTEKPETSKMTRMKDKTKGMIFMCSSKTKKDCYHYNILGLPANKRDAVFEIYKGMRLFLFDYDLKLMYGIYKAAGPGGYNIEPKAFNSAFPSQVRFTILEDCLPLAEEKFKKIIKDNYFSKSKFDFRLTSYQVKNLCKLFKAASKGSTAKQSHENSKAKAPIFVDHNSKRPRRSWKGENHTFVGRLHRPRAETLTFLHHDHSRHHGWEEERHQAFPRDHLCPEALVARRREVYADLVAHLPLRQAFPLPLTSVRPPLEKDNYRRNQLQYHDQQLLDVELGPRDEFEHRNSYRRSRYQDEFEHRDSYKRSRHQDELDCRDPLCSAGKPPEYYPPASRRPASKYHLSSGRLHDYKSRQFLHRRRHWQQHRHQHHT